MFRKIIAATMCFVMLSVCVFAEGMVYTLSLEEAITIAKDENPQLKACTAKKEDNKIQLKAAKETKAQYRDMKVIPASVAFELIYVKKGYYVHSYEKAVELSDYEYKQIDAQISYNVTEKYYNLKNCEKLVEISQNSYNLVLDNYNNSKLSYELGLISKAELDSANVSLLQAEFALESYKSNYELAKEDFKIALRKNNEDCNFVLTSNLKADVFETNLTEDLVTAEKSRYDINSLKANYELSKEYFDITFAASTTKKSAAQSSLITAEYNYTNNKSLILLGIKSSYSNITSSKNNVTLLEETLKLKENAYEIAKVQYEQGLITNTELLKILNDVYYAEVELENAKLKYTLAIDKYKYDVQIGI